MNCEQCGVELALAEDRVCVDDKVYCGGCSSQRATIQQIKMFNSVFDSFFVRLTGSRNSVGI